MAKSSEQRDPQRTVPGAPAGPSRLLRWQQRRGFPRPVEPTTGGWWFLLITFGVGVAAINTGNNLLYLVLGMLLALILASGVLSHVALLKLTLERRPPARIFARTPFLMGIAARNGKAQLPSFSLEIEDLDEQADTSPGRRCFFLKLAPGATEEASYRMTLARRGRQRLTAFRVQTRFPFGLFVKYLSVPRPAELIVLPELVEVPDLAAAAGGSGDQPRARRGRHGDFFAVREYREGDDVGDVHWRLSARAGRLVVREREDESASRITIEVDNGLPPGSSAEAAEEVERVISIAASLAARHIGRGEAVGIVARGAALPHAAGPSQLDPMLRFLALLEVVPPTVPFRTLGRDAPSVRVGAELARTLVRGARRSHGPEAAA